MINTCVFEANIATIKQHANQQGNPYWAISLPINPPRRKNQQTQEWEDEPNTETIWVNTIAWEPGPVTQAGKGARVLATGRLVARTWQDSDGNQRTSLELRNATLALIAPPKQPAQGPSWTQPTQQQAMPVQGPTQEAWDTNPPF